MNPVTQPVVMRWFVATLVAWTALTTAANLLLPGSPRDAWFVLMVIGAMLLPPIVFGIAYRRVPWVRDVALGLDLGAITAVQGMRIAGIAMLSLWAAGQMAPSFALWAGGLDVFVGLTAVPIAYAVASSRPLPRLALRWWNCVGLLDFAVAVPLGVLLTPSALGVLDGDPSTYEIFSFPLSFIPMVGVPFTIIMHVTALLQLRGDRSPTTGPLLTT